MRDQLWQRFCRRTGLFPEQKLSGHRGAAGITGNAPNAFRLSHFRNSPRLSFLPPEGGLFLHQQCQNGL